jgi:hypothetical protein
MMTSTPLPPDRQAAQDAARARTVPAVKPCPVVDGDPAVAQYLYYWSLPPKERRKIDADNEAMRERLNYV